MCFPVLFPSGRFGQFHPRTVAISSSEYVKSRLLNKDSRFRKDPQYVFFLLWLKELRELSAGVYNLMKRTCQQGMPVQLFLDKLAKSDHDVEANLSTMFQSVRGSRQYWFLRSSELKCMLREWGTPTLFVTFSCAEYESDDIGTYLRKVNQVPASYTIAKLCCEDPISVSKKFSLKFHAFFNSVILKGQVLGCVSHYFFKKEYQARGAPHYHAILWIQHAPVIGEDAADKIMHWIEERITCRIPHEKSNPELHSLVTKYQMHKCSKYCKRKKKLRGSYITRCRFGFPRDVGEKGALKCVEDCLRSRNKIYTLPRAEGETRVNDYNPLLLLLWKANIDIQFIAETSLALAHYVTGYVTKAERSNLQDLWQEVGSNRSVYSRLWSFGIRSLRSRECGLYKASDILLGDHLCGKSETVKWVDVSLPHKRNRRLKDYKELAEHKKQNPNSTEIFENNLIDVYYPNRPPQLDDVCLHDFAQDYEKRGDEYRKRSKPLLINHKLFDPNKEYQREDYFYSLLLLFVPFRDESELLQEGETAESSFNRKLQSNSGLQFHQKKLQRILQAQVNVKAIDDARQVEEAVSDGKEDPAEGLQIIGEAQAAMDDAQDLQFNCVNQLSLEDRMAMLNTDQMRVFNRLSSHLLHQKQHETDQCHCSAFQPLPMFVSGVGGTGKSFLIEAIRDHVGVIWNEKGSSITCCVAAPTELAAFNVGGVTVHRLFQLPIEHEGKADG